MKSKIISGVIAGGYLIASYSMGGVEPLLQISILLIFPIACIWFSDAMGGYTGMNFGFRPAITKTTPGCIVFFGGWVLLALPAILWVIAYLSHTQ